MSYRRRYIRENGRSAYRKNSDRREDLEPVFSRTTNERIGTVSRLWSSIYCVWVYEGQITYEGRVYTFQSTKKDPHEAITWMKDKHEALRNPQFARTIGEYIADSSFTHEDLADLADLSKPTISKWISGEMHPNISSLVRVCKILFGDLWWDKYLELSKMVELER